MIISFHYCHTVFICGIAEEHKFKSQFICLDMCSIKAGPIFKLCLYDFVYVMYANVVYVLVDISCFNTSWGDDRAYGTVRSLFQAHICTWGICTMYMFILQPTDNIRWYIFLGILYVRTESVQYLLLAHSRTTRSLTNFLWQVKQTAWTTRVMFY